MARFNKPHPIRDLKQPQVAQDIDDNFDAIFLAVAKLRELIEALTQAIATASSTTTVNTFSIPTLIRVGKEGDDGRKGVPGPVGPAGLNGNIGYRGRDGDDGRSTIKTIYNSPQMWYDAGNSGTALTLDWNNSSKQYFTLTGNVTLTINGAIDGGEYNILINTGAGAFTATFPAGAVYWPAATAPTITVTAGRYDLINLKYDALLGKYIGTFSQDHH